MKFLALNVFFFSCLYLSAQDFGKIDSIINAEIRQKNIAGGVALIIHKNNVVLDKAYGYADVAAARSMKTTDIFRIASQTKAIVSIAFLQLIERY